jgi:hypothetical protein
MIPSFQPLTVDDQFCCTHQDCFFVKSDLRKMFLQVEAALPQRHLMWFWSVARKCPARLTAMAMGFSGAPRWAHKLMSMICDYLQICSNLNLYSYVDKMLQAATSPDTFYLDAILFRVLAKFLGVAFNWAKSDCGRPTRTTSFCGVQMQSSFMTVSPTVSRVANIREMAAAILNRRSSRLASLWAAPLQLSGDSAEHSLPAPAGQLPHRSRIERAKPVLAPERSAASRSVQEPGTCLVQPQAMTSETTQVPRYVLQFPDHRSLWCGAFFLGHERLD